MPVGTAKICSEVPLVGAGAHWNAHPMNQVPLVIVNVGLVQLPVCSVLGTRTCTWPEDAVPAGVDVGVVDNVGAGADVGT